jgi:hypothetical protein
MVSAEGKAGEGRTGMKIIRIIALIAQMWVVGFSALVAFSALCIGMWGVFTIALVALIGCMITSLYICQRKDERDV